MMVLFNLCPLYQTASDFQFHFRCPTKFKEGVLSNERVRLPLPFRVYVDLFFMIAFTRRIRLFLGLYHEFASSVLFLFA